MLADKHPTQLTQLASEQTAFHQSKLELGRCGQGDYITPFGFGRTITGTDGSDHGWGSMQFMMRYAIAGDRYYGSAPLIANDGPDDSGRGRLIPTTSVDQFAAALDKWFGTSDNALLTVLPNLGNSNSQQCYLAFV